MKEIELTQGLVTIVDDEDWHWLSFHRWSVVKLPPGSNGLDRIYVRTYIGGSFPYMHRMIIEALDGQDVDHVSGDSLDNRRSNLRACSRSQNLGNQVTRTGNKTSVYKGVCWAKRDRVWIAGIRINGRTRFLGNFKTELEAAQMYDLKARELFGEFARPNFP